MKTSIRLKLCIGLFSLSYCLSQPALAIVSLESFHLGTPTPGLSGHLTVNVDGALGNEERRTFELEGRVQHARDKLLHFVTGNYAYSESFNKSSQNKAFIHARRIQNLQAAIALEVFGQVEKNEFARLSLRALLGSGLRFGSQQEKRYAAFFGAGLFYSLESLDAPEDEQVKEIKGNFYAVYKRQIREHIVFVNTLYFQPVLKTPRDFRVLETLAFRFSLSEKLSFQLSLEVNHDSRPPLTVKETDVNYMTGLSYKF